jgi:prophage regulatory protein
MSMSDVTHVFVDNDIVPVGELLKRKELVAMLGLCYTTIYNMEKAGKFPARRKVSRGRVAWLRSEVEDWIRALPTV